MRGLLLSLLFVSAACASILGDDFDVTGGAGANGAGAGSTNGAAGSMTTSSGGGANVGGGDIGGAGNCLLGTAQGCEMGFKCTVTDEQTGAVGCLPNGPRIAFSACDIDTQCVVGTYCDNATDVCKPICMDSADCGGGGSCIASANVPGLLLCTADCEPENATPCSQSDGPTTCARTMNGLDCVKSSGGDFASPCFGDSACGPGLLCEGDNCWDWCGINLPATCSGGDFCAVLNPAVFDSEGQQYGICTIG